MGTESGEFGGVAEFFEGAEGEAVEAAAVGAVGGGQLVLGHVCRGLGEAGGTQGEAAEGGILGGPCHPGVSECLGEGVVVVAVWSGGGGGHGRSAVLEAGEFRMRGKPGMPASDERRALALADEDPVKMSTGHPEVGSGERGAGEPDEASFGLVRSGGHFTCCASLRISIGWRLRRGVCRGNTERIRPVLDQRKKKLEHLRNF